MREQNELEALKRNWEHDPCYDIEEAEGFEEHKEELLAFRKEREAHWKKLAQEAHTKLESMICPILSIGEGDFGYCKVEQCAWWNEQRNKCGILQVY